jgi:1-acyl-sn-glycerol-3-phosphate acyltransferase
MAFFFFLRIFSALTSIFVRKVNFPENLKVEGGAVFAANHASYLDHFIAGSRAGNISGKYPYFLAKKEHFQSLHQRIWHRFLKAIPIDRDSGGHDALDLAIEHLKSGKMIFIYPEGTRTLTGKMNRAKTGVARLALSAHVPVIPIGLTNTFKILPKGKYLPSFGTKTDINIGKPMYFDSYYGKENDKETLRKVTTLIMAEIARLSNQTYEYDREYLK